MTVNTATIVLNEGTESPLAITVRELTVKEIREWFEEVQKDPQVGLIDALLLKELTLSDLTRLSSLHMDQIEQLGPIALRKVVAAARDLNPDFFDFRDRVIRVGASSKAEASPAA